MIRSASVLYAAVIWKISAWSLAAPAAGLYAGPLSAAALPLTPAVDAPHSAAARRFHHPKGASWLGTAIHGENHTIKIGSANGVRSESANHLPAPSICSRCGFASCCFQRLAINGTVLPLWLELHHYQKLLLFKTPLSKIKEQFFLTYWSHGRTVPGAILMAGCETIQAP